MRSPRELMTYLTRYVAKYYPRLTVTDSFIDQRGAFVYCPVTRGGKVYRIRLRLPFNAPVQSIPLFDSLLLGEEVVWRYSVNYRPNVPWGEQHRVHLYHFEGFHVLMYVVGGSPRDLIERATHVNGSELRPELAALLRTKVAQLWGMTTTITKAERRKLLELEKQGMTSSPIAFCGRAATFYVCTVCTYLRNFSRSN